MIEFIFGMVAGVALAKKVKAVRNIPFPKLPKYKR